MALSSNFYNLIYSKSQARHEMPTPQVNDAEIRHSCACERKGLVLPFFTRKINVLGAVL